MKFKLDKISKDKLNRLLEANERNNNVAEFYNAYLESDFKAISPKLINKLCNENMSLEEAFYYCMLGINEVDYDDPYIQILNRKNELGKVSKLDINEYLDNPYYKNIKCMEKSYGNVKLEYRSYKAFEGFVYDDVKTDSEYNEITKFGFFDKEFKFLTLSKKEHIWMSVTPHEINTMKEAVNEAKGHVLVLGLGLGYYQYMISLKDEVESILIVEKDPNVIKIFNENILPQFEHKEKIQIQQLDAFKLLEQHSAAFDYVFADLWHDGFDGLEMYYKICKSENLRTKFSYWIEDSMIAVLRRCMITLIEEQLNNFKDENYKKADNFTDELINKLHFKYKDLEINSYEQIEKLLSKDNLRCLIRNI